MSDEPIHTLNDMAAVHHELYLSWCRAGFTETQAFQLFDRLGHEANGVGVSNQHCTVLTPHEYRQLFQRGLSALARWDRDARREDEAVRELEAVGTEIARRARITREVLGRGGR